MLSYNSKEDGLHHEGEKDEDSKEEDSQYVILGIAEEVID